MEGERCRVGADGDVERRRGEMKTHSVPGLLQFKMLVFNIKLVKCVQI